MKIQLGQLVFSDLTQKELDDLVKRYGGSAPKGAATKGDGDSPGAGGPLPKDMVILKNFISAGRTGIKATDLGEMLGPKGKSTYPAARTWAMRVGLTESDTAASDPFERCQIGTNRAIRLKPSLMEIATEILKGAGKDSP